MLATSFLGASRRLMACTSSLPLRRDPSSSPKSSARQRIASSGATGKECPTLGTWSIYDDSIRRIVLNFNYVFSCTSFKLSKYHFKQSSTMCWALPSPPSCHKPLPLDMLRGLATANTRVAKPGGPNFFLFLSLDTLGGLDQRQPKGRTT
jgi:hypothetical protein